MKENNSEENKNVDKKVKLETSEDEVTESLNETINTENNVSNTEVGDVKVKQEKGGVEGSNRKMGAEDGEGSET